MIKIQDSDLFVYVGGEMEKWSDKVVDSLDTTGTEIICIADFVETMKEISEEDPKKYLENR